MSAKHFKVELTQDQRKELELLAKTGAAKSFIGQRAQNGLRVDQDPHGAADTDRAAAELLAISHRTVLRAR